MALIHKSDAESFLFIEIFGSYAFENVQNVLFSILISLSVRSFKKLL